MILKITENKILWLFSGQKRLCIGAVKGMVVAQAVDI